MLRLRRVRIPFFRIWYSTTYTFLFIATLILIAATPGDLIYQAIRNEQIQQVFAVGGSTLLAAILVVLIYSTRLYTNRSVLAAIPKSYLPIERDEVGSSIRKLIVKAWHRSAIIAWDSRPRDLTDELLDTDPVTTQTIHDQTRKNSHIPNATIIRVVPESPQWGTVAHAGWSSPSSTDLPGLQYWSVLLELPNLIEAKAVSLAPPDPAFEPSPAEMAAGLAPIPDERVVVLLRRPPGTGIREYIARLSQLQLINPPQLGAVFLNKYEYARFSTSSLTEKQFRELLDVFGELLAGMSQLNPVALINILEAEGDFDTEASSLIDSFATNSEAGSVRRYLTPGASSAGGADLSAVTTRTNPSQEFPQRERLFSAVSHISDDSTMEQRPGLEDIHEDHGRDATDSASINSAQSLSSVIRRPAKPAD